MVNPRTLINEINLLETAGLSYNNLMLSLNAKLIMPQHVVLDRVREASSGKGRIGTTGRGIGPAYADHYSRVGLVVNDLLNKDLLVEKITRNLREKNLMLKSFDPDVIRGVMFQDDLDKGVFYTLSSSGFFNVDAIVETYYKYGQKLSGIIKETDRYLNGKVEAGFNVLLEGAQGLFLSIDYGSYPYVTSSDCSVAGLAKGVGLQPSQVNVSFGIVKGFYMTRVGEGPFPTEFGGEASAQWCATKKRSDEEGEYPDASINDPDEFIQGVAMRREGDEYGATTGRPRRTGWLDLPMLRYAVGINGHDIIMTKLDVLSGCKTIKVCTSYKYQGPDFHYGDATLKARDVIYDAIPMSEVMKHCVPEYVEFPGWESDLSDAKWIKDLPERLRVILNFVQEKTGVIVRMLSVGPDREQTVVRHFDD